MFVVMVTLAACGGSKKAPEPVTSAAASEPAPAAEPPAAEPPAPEPAAVDPAKVKTDLLAAETAAFEKAKPVFDKFCASCHSKSGKQANRKKLHELDITSYPFTGEHANELGEEMREVLGIGGGKPTMPKGKPGIVKGDDLALIAAWADAWDAAHKAGAHGDAAAH